MSSRTHKALYLRNTQRGISLVELLIAMTLGLLIIVGMLAVFSSNKRSSDLNNAMSDIQESARFALNRISQDIRMAGYQGCLDAHRGLMTVKAVSVPMDSNGVDSSGNPTFDSRLSSVSGSIVEDNGQWLPAIPGGLTPPTTNPAIPGTHVLSVQYGSSDDSALAAISTLGSLSATLKTVDPIRLNTGDLALVGNCEAVDLFSVTGADTYNLGHEISHAAGPNQHGNLTLDYDAKGNITGARVMRFVTRVYYIGDTGLENESGDQIRGLYLQTFPFNDPDNPPTEIVQGVEDMRIAFGQRSGKSLRYITADDSDYDPSAIVSVQLGLIMNSWDEVAAEDDDQTYIIAGQSIGPSSTSPEGFRHGSDQRYRLAFNTTVKIRNRRDEEIKFE